MPQKNLPLHPTRPSSPRNKNTAALLSLLLGGIGINRFYLGQNNLGILSIIFCWTFIPALVGVFDFFIFLLMSNKKFDKKYNMAYCIDCDEAIGTFTNDMYCNDCLEDIIEKKNKELKTQAWIDVLDEDNDNDDTTYIAAKTTQKKKKVKSKSSASESKNIEDVLKEMDSLVGLEDVKEEIATLINFIKIQKERKDAGLKSSSLSYHLVFTGNPGTGKTTVARIISQIYKHLGILENGHLIETDRSGLVAQYMGQTSIKVNHVVDTALNGILFIDEAYALNLKDDSYGTEAVATLIKRMEDDRENLVVILAGYTNEMKSFIDTNPGFQSRFNRYINFPDYTPAELLEIFEILCSKADYVLDPSAKEKALELFINSYANRTSSFGNGRLVRNVFENAIENQSNRIIREKNTSKQNLTTITADDIMIIA